MTMKLPIKMITLDAFDTLFQVRGNIGQIYADAVNKYYLATGRRLNSENEKKVEEEFNVAYKYYYQKWPNFGLNDRISSEQWWHCVIRLTLYNMGYVQKESVMRSITNQLYTDFCLPKHWEVFPEVHETLSKLRHTGIRLGVLSNFDERLEMVMDNMKLTNYFDFVSCSKILGVAKPDINIFLKTAELNNMDCKNCLHIGDNIDLDYHAARKAGMHAARIDRTLKEFHPSEPVTLHKLTDIFHLVEVSDHVKQ